ncbi:hypothetical protein DDB_G0271938 [Dictyostelium discoideum AX4]|uniref:B box-type domain-containing protein n=1 Tax=Dictyostelium discoideum TaxID=44689 RepID=Q55AE3_DICDI|nr:hypothetical protein DDB_G0271938 [Dictyostelium discoideum AX4]EAL71493.1 hypothetical protein DDB_G0271938 [Dictyostelium discoideum AX4]|eukprot:XP_645413.1 hypothetical protein DDB_G0271938 [Dictyostelium discoideum AX4]
MSNKNNVNNKNYFKNFYFKNNNKCFQHENKDIIAICSQCMNTPVCLECATNKLFHQGHILETINKDTITPIINEFKDIIKPQLIQYSNKSQEFLNNLDIKFKELSSTHKTNITLINKEFKQLHLILQIIENDLIKQLETNFDENLQTNTIIKSFIENNLKIILKTCEIIDNKNNNNNDDEYQLIQIIKTYYHFKKQLNNNNHINNINNNSCIGEINFSKFNNKIVSIKKESSEIIKECLNSIITLIPNDNYNCKENEELLVKDINTSQLIRPIQPSYKPHFTQTKPFIEKLNINNINNNNNNNFKYFNYLPNQNIIINNENEKFNMKQSQFGIYNEKKSMVYQDGVNIPNDIEFITIGEGQHLPDKIPINCKWILLPDGFNESLQSLPSTVENLCIYNLKSIPNYALIPKSIKSIHFYDEFNNSQQRQLNLNKK